MRTDSAKPWFRKVKNCWYAWVGGKQVSLAVRGKDGKKAAQEAFYRLMADGKPKAKNDTATVKEIVEAFLSDVEGRAKPKTVEVYRYLLTGFVAKFGGRTADGIKPHEAEAFARKPSWSSSTRNGFLGALVSAFKWAVRAGVLDTNPLTTVRKPPKTSRGAKAVITKAEFKRLHLAASIAFKPFLMGLWLTGCRPGELARLTAANLNLTSGVAVLAEHKTADKTGKPRLIFLSPEAVTLFKSQAESNPHGVLFPNTNGGGWNEDSIIGAMKSTRKKAKLPHATAYGFRHSFATDALAHGVPDATVAALLGHSSTNMLHKHYSHLTSRTDVLLQAVAKVR